MAEVGRRQRPGRPERQRQELTGQEEEGDGEAGPHVGVGGGGHVLNVVVASVGICNRKERDC